MSKSSRSSEEQRFEEIAKFDPETLANIEQYLAENLPTVQNM
jgi:hypothetical protein